MGKPRATCTRRGVLFCPSKLAVFPWISLTVFLLVISSAQRDMGSRQDMPHMVALTNRLSFCHQNLSATALHGFDHRTTIPTRQDVFFETGPAKACPCSVHLSTQSAHVFRREGIFLFEYTIMTDSVTRNNPRGHHGKRNGTDGDSHYGTPCAVPVSAQSLTNRDMGHPQG